MFTVAKTDLFNSWLANLSDAKARARIVVRLLRLEAGNFGDAKSVGDGVIELRIHHGPGYRVYLIRTGRTVIVVLAGGDKTSQASDILAAKKMAAQIPRET